MLISNLGALGLDKKKTPAKTPVRPSTPVQPPSFLNQAIADAFRPTPPLLANKGTGEKDLNFENEKGEIRRGSPKGPKVYKFTASLANGMDIDFESDRDLTDDEIQGVVNQYSKTPGYQQTAQKYAKDKKARDNTPASELGPYDNRKVAVNNQADYEQKQAKIASGELRPNGQPASGFDLSGAGIMDSMRRLLQAIPNAVESANVDLPGKLAELQGVPQEAQLQMRNMARKAPLTAEQDRAERAALSGTNAAKRVAEAAQFFVPVVGPIVGTAGLVSMADSARKDFVGTAKQSVDAINPFAPNLDPLERGLRSVNLAATVLGAYHGVNAAKGALENYRQIKAANLDHATQVQLIVDKTGLSHAEAAQALQWADEASAPAQKPTATGTIKIGAVTGESKPIAGVKPEFTGKNPTLKTEPKVTPTVEIKPGVNPNEGPKPNEKTNQQTIRDVQEGQGIRDQGEQPQGQGYGQKANAFKEKGQVTPESVGVKSGMKDPHAGKSGVWKGPDADQPIKVEKTLGTKNGQTYVKVEGSNTGVPLDEITFDAPAPSTPKPSGTRTRASAQKSANVNKPTPKEPQLTVEPPPVADPNQTGLKMSTRSEEASRGLTSEPISIGGKPLSQLQQEGVARVESGKVDPNALIEKLANGRRPATDEEYGSLAAGRAKLIKRVEEAQSARDTSNTKESLDDYHEALDAAAEFDAKLDKVKSASGLSLNALKIGSNLNEASSAEVLLEARRRNPKVSPKKEAQLTELANTVRDTSVADNAAIADAVVSHVKADPKFTFKGKKEAIRSERDALLQQLEKARNKGNSGSNVRGSVNIPVDILQLYGKIGLTYAKEGLVTFEEIADAIRTHAKANGHGLSDDDVREALRGALPKGRTLTELELKNRRMNEIARNRIRAILGDLKPVSGVKRVENALRESQLSNPVSRVMDWLSNEATKLAYVAESPVRYVVTRGKEKPIGPVAYRELMRGSRDRWANEAKAVMAGADPDAITKYGKSPGIVSKVTGLSDVQFKDFYHQVVYRDMAVKTHPKDIKAQREMIDQLNGITDGGPLSDGAVADIQAEANDFALRKTFNADNWFASATTAGAGTLRREAYKGLIKSGVSEKAAANAADLLTFIPNVAFRYSKVIGNVAHDAVTRTGAGVLEASAGRVAAGMRVEREGLRIRLRRAGISDAQSRILSDKFARGLTGAALTGVGAALAAKGIMKPDIVKTGSTYFFDYGELEQLGGWVKPILLGSTIQTINEMNISEDKKQKLRAKAVGDLALNQPLTSGFKQLATMADITNLPKALGRVAATALVPGIVAGTARMHDKITTGTGYRKTKGPEDEFKSRVPGLRQTLPSGEKSRIKGKPGLPF